MDNSNSQFSGLPPPPQGQTGQTLDQFQHLPPPPSGQKGVSIDEIQGAQSQPTANYGRGQNPGVDVSKNMGDVTDALGKVFPAAKQLGTDVGNSLFATGEAIKGGIQELRGNKAGAQESFKNVWDTANEIQPGKDFGAGVNIGATVAAPVVGGETALGRIGANAALGTTIGASNAAEQGGGLKEMAKQGAVGGAVGGGVAAAGEGLNALAQKLPSWFVQKALPKLNPANTDMVLNDTHLGSIKSMLSDSNNAVSSYGNQIDSILSHPQYAEETGNLLTTAEDGTQSSTVAQQVMDKYPNAQLNENAIASKIKSVAPLQKDLVDSVLDGSANLKEQNQLRQTLDRAVYPKFTDTPSLTANKQLAKTFTDALRANVQSTAPETQDVFANFSKEIDLNKALSAAQTKIQKGATVGLYDILSVAGGMASGGPLGGLGAIGLEKAARSPAVQIGAAKAIQGVVPLAQAAGKALKAPILNAITRK